MPVRGALQFCFAWPLCDSAAFFLDSAILVQIYFEIGKHPTCVHTVFTPSARRSGEVGRRAYSATTA
jgi:hypothetical protein